MRLHGLADFERPVYVLVLPVIAVLLTSLLVPLMLSEPGMFAHGSSRAQQVGTFLMLGIMPPYLIGCVVLLMRQTRNALTAVADLVPSEQMHAVLHRLHHLGGIAFPVVVCGVLYGLAQNAGMVSAIAAGGPFTTADVTLIIGNSLLWAVVGFVIAWRIPVSLALLDAGRKLTLDLYRIDRLRPLANLATKDVLVVAGAMVLMPLQSLDAEFRWGNYEAGFMVGVPVAIGLFLLPLLGLRANIRQAKQARVKALTAGIDLLSRDDVDALETHMAHIDRIRNIADWPLDVASLSKVFAYIVIPPVAWVGAALVENVVDRIGP